MPFTFVDNGPDNVAGNGGRSDADVLRHPDALMIGCTATVTSPTPTCVYPDDADLQNAAQNGTYKTFELSVNKRQSHNYSLSAGFGYTWQHDFPLTFPNTPNGPFDYDYRGFELQGSTASTKRRAASASARSTGSRRA